MYGGHITDNFDRRVDMAYLAEIMQVELFANNELAPGFNSPPCEENYDYYRNYIEEKFPVETPTLFGLHSNAEIVYLLDSARALFEIVQDLGGVPLDVGGDAADSSEDSHGMSGGIAGQMCDDLLERTPEKLDMLDLELRAADKLTNPFVCVVLQEVERMNKLLGVITVSLQELRLGLDGALNMSDAMELLLNTLPLDRVPAAWATVAYPSLKSLGAWFVDLLQRVETLTPWMESLETPVVVWISGLFNPMAYITAILQYTARKTSLPLDQMEVWTDITSSTDTATFTEYPEDGMYIHGLCMEGARWETKKNAIGDSFSKDLHPVMPVMQVRGIVYENVNKDGIFDCPVYITTQRGGTITFTATLRTLDPVNKWVLGGVALMMQWDDG